MPPSKADLAKIHIAKKELGLTDEAYRDILRIQFKRETSAKLTPGQAGQLLGHFRTLGWKPKIQTALPGRQVPEDGKSKKIRALWITLHKAGVIRDGSDKAMLSFAKRITRTDRLQWATDAQKSMVIEALKAMAKAREGVNCG